MSKPLLVYDGACTVCVRQVKNLQFLLPEKFMATSFRDPEFSKKYPSLDLAECEKAIQFVDPKGRQYAGAEAVARVMALSKMFWPLMWLYYVPGLRRLWDSFYEWIARNRFGER